MHNPKLQHALTCNRDNTLRHTGIRDEYLGGAVLTYLVDSLAAFTYNHTNFFTGNNHA